LTALLHLALLAAAIQAAPADWAALEERGAVISEIRVERQDVFDPANPDDNTALGRLADHLHWTTREKVVRRALLFHVGEKVNLRRIRETERHLRSMSFLKDARVDLEPLPDGSVRARVWVRDAWTLLGTINYKLLGGQQTRGAGIQEQNILGTGKTLNLAWKQDPVRTTETAAYYDPQLLGRDWSLLAIYQNLSDGRSRSFSLQRPYTSLDTPWAVSVQASSTAYTLTVYDQGNGIYAAASQLDTASAGFSWAARHGEADAWRPGLEVVDNKAAYGPLAVLSAPGAVPAPDFAFRKLAGPALTLSYMQEHYGVFRDMAGMDTPEDDNLGWSGSVAAGSYLPAWGATERAPFVQSALAKGWSGSDRDLLLMQAGVSGRKGPGGWRDVVANLTFNGYWKATPHQVSAAHLALNRADRPDPEDILYLGATQGLRGYSNELHPGDASWLFSAEQRMLTERRWLGILRLGYVVFADTGGIHRLDGTGWSPTYADVGGGLRLGDLKSSLGHVFLLTVAAPLTRQPGQRGWLFAVGNIVAF
jgi:hypothetical protein